MINTPDKWIIIYFEKNLQGPYGVIYVVRKLPVEMSLSSVTQATAPVSVNP